MTLREKQSAFTGMAALLIGEMFKRGYEVTLGESWRRPGVGWKGSLHRKRLAIDLNLFLNGRYLTSTKSHEIFGVWWEQQGHKKNLPLTWGGRFKKADGNHYSLSYQGVR